MPRSVNANGSITWFDDENRIHREDGPAVVTDAGSKYYWHRQHLHRFDGPAVETSKGTTAWWFYGTNVTDIIKKWAEARGLDLANLTEEDKCAIILEFGHYEQKQNS